jgi:hypothetical protein
MVNYGNNLKKLFTISPSVRMNSRSRKPSHLALQTEINKLNTAANLYNKAGRAATRRRLSIQAALHKLDMEIKNIDKILDNADTVLLVAQRSGNINKIDAAYSNYQRLQITLTPKVEKLEQKKRVLEEHYRQMSKHEKHFSRLVRSIIYKNTSNRGPLNNREFEMFNKHVKYIKNQMKLQKTLERWEKSHGGYLPQHLKNEVIKQAKTIRSPVGKAASASTQRVRAFSASPRRKAASV